MQGFANRFVPHDTYAKDLQDQRVLLLLVAPDANLAQRTLGRLVEMAGQLNAQGTAKLLRLAGLPGTQNRRVADAQQAWTAAQTLGLPTVVKPNDLDRSEGVFTDYSVRSPNSLEQALRAGGLQHTTMEERMTMLPQPKAELMGYTFAELAPYLCITARNTAV